MASSTMFNGIMVATLSFTMTITAVFGLSILVDAVHSLVRNIRDLRRTLKGGR